MVRQEGAGCFRGNERQWVLERMGKWRRQSWRVGMGGHLMGLYQLYPQKSGIRKRGVVRVAFKKKNVFIWLSWTLFAASGIFLVVCRIFSVVPRGI